MKNIFKNVKGYRKLDYVSSWYMLGAKYISGTNAELSFVTTNSIFEGEQVPILWPKIFEENVDFFFAYSPFKWTNSAKNIAGVIVVIAGLKSKDNKENKVFFDRGKKKVNITGISPYLTIGSSVIVKKANNSVFKLPGMQKGNAAYDNGYLTFTKSEYEEFIQKNPESKNLFKRYISASDFMNGKYKYCLWINKNNILTAKKISAVNKRINDVEQYRKDSKRVVTQKAASFPYRFGEIRYQNNTAMIIPVVSSDNRYYIPILLIDGENVPSYSNYVLYNPHLWLIGLLESRMHMSWVKAICGRLGTDFRYSAKLVYNTFPVPKLSTRRKNEIEQLTLNILDIREEEGGTLAELYGSPLAEKNPKPMNPRLLKAHQELDEVVDRAYKANGFKDDNERLALLLEMYGEKIKNEE